jgi:predicted NBD/HSP70 family sugar kinase
MVTGRAGRERRIVANTETARDINRRVLLNLIRARQPISRADLARCSGMQPSTVSLITEELIEEKWVVEGPIGHLPRGRKPRCLRLNSNRASVVAIDIRPGGTRVGIADLNGHFLAQEIMPTARRPRDFLSALCLRVQGLIAAHPAVELEAIGVSLPGRVDSSTNRLLISANLGWRDVDLKTPLEQATGLPVELENAANACALAELWFGSHAPGETDLAVITVSEGIGAGIIVDGRLVRGEAGLAGEFGHITIAHDGPVCGCGNRGCWELYASNTAAIRYYIEASTGSLPDLELARGPDAPRFEEILALAERGDENAGKALDKAAYFLGVGLATLVTTLTPQVIMLCGEVTHAWSRIEPVLKRVTAERSLLHRAPRILPLEEHLLPRLRGTVALVMQKYFALPDGYGIATPTHAGRSR